MNAEFAEAVAPAITLLALAMASLIIMIGVCWSKGQPREIRLLGSYMFIVLLLVIGACVVLTVALYNN